MDQDAMSQLQRLFAEHPELTERVQSATSVPVAAEQLSAVAAEHGIVIDAATLVSEMEQAQGKIAEGGSLSDDQLEGVVGGVTLGTLAFSILGVGLTCALASVIDAASKRDCGKEMEKTLAEWGKGIEKGFSTPL